ncbi:hypothetical protein TELCIR_07790 [Teladorsagia circumcincta]|uniref:Uncharacterized protein n=1 Tax=Teladorsagia circumcincta TaxID=45464 RepID=A0A2G9ULK4_TELCI|nr:hypothetical protein TELCIR_07790 [Teladorsagia circumcincta]
MFEEKRFPLIVPLGSTHHRIPFTLGNYIASNEEWNYSEERTHFRAQKTKCYMRFVPDGLDDVPLKYWSVLGGGPRGETPANFDDFHPFAKFTKPTVKQFAQVEKICGITVNRDVYAVNGVQAKAAVTQQNDESLVVGETFENVAFKGLLKNE